MVAQAGDRLQYVDDESENEKDQNAPKDEVQP
jgi:hypothetical protein